MEPEMVCIDSFARSSGMGVIRDGGFLLRHHCHTLESEYKNLYFGVLFLQRQYLRRNQGSHSDWKTWKNGKAFSSQGKVKEF